MVRLNRVRRHGRLLLALFVMLAVIGAWPLSASAAETEVTVGKPAELDFGGLLAYIVATQNKDGSFGPYANEYGTKAPLEALAAVIGDLESASEGRTAVQRAIERAVSYFGNRYASGELYYDATGFGFDYRCVEAMILAGEDLSEGRWVQEGTSLRDQVLAAVSDAVYNRESEDAVDLAKHLSVLTAVYPESADISTLAETVAGRQAINGGFTGDVFSDVMILTALGKAGQVGLVDAATTLDYLLEHKQIHKDASGRDAGWVWGSTWDGAFHEEPDLTAQVLIALSYFLGTGDEKPELQAAIDNALTYLCDVQDPETGAIAAPWDNTFATAETLLAGKRLGLGPAPGFSWDPPTVENPGTVDPAPDPEWVRVAVVGQGELLFGPGRVFIDEDNPWGSTALGALDATGLDYSAGSNGFVTSIAGLANTGLNGWMYKVNDTLPAVAAHQKRVSEGDRVIWWYSDDPYSTGPVWADLEKGLPGPPEEEGLPPEAAEKLTVLRTALEALTDEIRPAGITVITGERLGEAERSRLREELADNVVGLRQKISTEGGLVADELLEAGVWIPAESLRSETQITVRELRSETVHGQLPLGRSLASGIYDFGPDGLKMAGSVLLFIRCVPDEGAAPEHLTVALWNPDRRNWEILPGAVYDQATGLLGVGVDHFSRYAVFLPADSGTEMQTVPWAEEAVRALGIRGLFSGMGRPVDLQHPVTRGEFAGWLVRTFGFAPGDTGAAAFTDVAADHPWAREIGAAAELGLVRGYGDGTFRPERVLTRQDMAALLIRALEMFEPAAAAGHNPGTEFVDADRVAPWAKSSMDRAVSLGLIRGYPGNRLAPLEDCTRVQSLAVLWRLAEQLEAPENG